MNQLKVSLTLSILVLISASVHAQFVAKMELKEPVSGVCDANEVYALFPMLQGQEEATCPVSKDEILERLNTEVAFVKSNPKHNDKGMIGIIVNCEGLVVQCKMDNKTKNQELDKQIEAVFAGLGEWKAGKLNGKTVDSSRLFSFKIKNGKFRFE